MWMTDCPVSEEIHNLKTEKGYALCRRSQDMECSAVERKDGRKGDAPLIELSHLFQSLIRNVKEVEEFEVILDMEIGFEGSIFISDKWDA